MSRRRKSSVLLPFKATPSRVGHHSSYAENVTQTRNLKTPAKRRRTQVEMLDPEINDDGLETCQGTVSIHHQSHFKLALSYLLNNSHIPTLEMKGKMWNIYRVTDLNNFNYKKNTLSRYGRILSRSLVESFTAEAITLNATFIQKSDIHGIESQDPPVHITVEDVQFSEPRLVYEGVCFF